MHMHPPPGAGPLVHVGTYLSPELFKKLRQSSLFEINGKCAQIHSTPSKAHNHSKHFNHITF